MKYFRRAATAAVLFGIAGSSVASGTTTVDVTATVTPVCVFKSPSNTGISLGAIDPSTVAAAVTGTVDVGYNCNTGTSPTVTFTSGTGARTLTETSDATKTISYTFSLGTPSAGSGFSAAGSAKVVATATISQAAAQDAKAGTYSDTVSLDISP